VSRKLLERGQIMPFFIFTILALGLMTAVGLEIGRIVYARGEVGQAADAAALAAAARLDVARYRETGQLVFRPDAGATAQEYAARNAGFLAAHRIGVGVSQIWIDPGSRVVFVTVTADLSSLLPGFLAHRGQYSATGYARTRMQGTP
jgi:Flp pilus assembly protein TadG